MLSRVKTLALVATLAAASGCSVSGNVTFQLSFGGTGGCMANQAVKTIRITIPGQTLENQGVYNCSEQVLLLNFAPGSYTFTAEAFGGSNERLFIKQGTFNVNGNVVVNVNLAPADESNSYAYLTWGFPLVGNTNNPTCAQAGIMYVDYAIDSGQAVRVNCVDGQTQSGSPTAALRPGNHTIQLDGLGSTGTRYFSKTGTLVVNPGNAIAADFKLDWAVGGAALAWSFFDAGPASCTSTGVAQVRVNFRRADGTFVFGAAGDLQPCTAPSAFYYLEAGAYSVVVDAQGSAGRVYSTNTTTPPTLTITTAGFNTTPQLLRLDRI
jgi:hypothetical protein